MESKLLKPTFFLILFCCISNAQFINFGNGNIATAKENMFSGRNNFADGYFNKFQGTNNLAHGLLNDVKGNLNIADGTENTISGQGNLVSGNGNIVVSGNQMNMDQFKKNFKFPSVQDEISKRFQSLGMDSLANIFGPQNSQLSNNGIQPQNIQTQSKNTQINTPQNGNKPNTLSPSVPSGFQTSNPSKGASTKNQIPLPKPIDSLPNLNLGSSNLNILAQRMNSLPQTISNPFDQYNTPNGNNIQLNNLQNTGFQTLQNLQNLQKMAEKPSLIMANLPFAQSQQFNNNRLKNDGLSQSWMKTIINPLDLNENQNYLGQDWTSKFTGQNRVNPSNIQYNMPSFPSPQPFSYQSSLNPFLMSPQNWMDPRSIYNGAINLPSYENYQMNSYWQNQPLPQMPNLMQSQSIFRNANPQFSFQNMRSGQFQQFRPQQRQSNLRSNQAPQTGFRNNGFNQVGFNGLGMTQNDYQTNMQQNIAGSGQTGFQNLGLQNLQNFFNRY